LSSKALVKLMMLLFFRGVAVKSNIKLGFNCLSISTLSSLSALWLSSTTITGIQLLENRHQGDFFISRFRKRQQVAVFLVGIAIVFVAAPQAIETENAKGQVFLYGRSVESRTL
jgi:hypothetical protein